MRNEILTAAGVLIALSPNLQWLGLAFILWGYPLTSVLDRLMVGEFQRYFDIAVTSLGFTAAMISFGGIVDPGRVLGFGTGMFVVLLFALLTINSLEISQR